MAETTSATKQKTSTPEQQARRKAARVIGYTAWRDDWNAANPEGTPEARKAAWEGARTEATQNARKILRTLEKKGLRVVAVEPAGA